MKKSKNEKKKAQQKSQTTDKGTNTKLIKMEKSNDVMNEVVLVEELREVEIADKATST
jgi:hypothetical protein